VEYFIDVKGVLSREVGENNGKMEDKKNRKGKKKKKFVKGKIGLI